MESELGFSYCPTSVSASSFINGRRFTNVFSIDEYVNAVICNRAPEISSEEITGEDARFESVMLALRTEEGLNVKKFNAEFSCDFFAEYKTALKNKGKYLDVTPERVKIKDEFLYVQNDIILEFMK